MIVHNPKPRAPANPSSAAKKVNNAEKCSLWILTTILRITSRIKISPPMLIIAILNSNRLITKKRTKNTKEIQSRRVNLSMTPGFWRVSKGSNLTPNTNSVAAIVRRRTTFGRAQMRMKAKKKKKKRLLKVFAYIKPLAIRRTTRSVFVAVWSRKRNCRKMNIDEVAEGKQYTFLPMQSH